MTKGTNVPNDQATVDADQIEGRLVPLDVESSTVSLLNKGEIDMQIATAHKYPRSVKVFRDEVRALATLTVEVAEECSYALPRDGKTIIGPSARFAEIIGSSWGNCRYAARIVDERGGFIVGQGAFLDLQKNVAITYEVQRRITGKSGKRYSEDMIGTTANAACSIALRNAILKGIPKALWADLWAQARMVAVGDATTLANRRANAIKKLAQYGATEPMMLKKLGRASVEDVTPNDLELVLGILTSLKEGDSSVEELFADEGTAATSKGGNDAIKDAMRGSGNGEQANKDAPPGAGQQVTTEYVQGRLEAAAHAKDWDLFEAHATLIGKIEGDVHREQANKKYQTLRADLRKTLGMDK